MGGMVGDGRVEFGWWVCEWMGLVGGGCVVYALSTEGLKTKSVGN
jgi:hypothetical protein